MNHISIIMIQQSYTKQNILLKSRGGSRIFPREGRLAQRGGIFRVGGRRGLTWAPYPYPISYLYTYEYAISRNINFIDLR